MTVGIPRLPHPHTRFITHTGTNETANPEPLQQSDEQRTRMREIRELRKLKEEFLRAQRDGSRGNSGKPAGLQAKP